MKRSFQFLQAVVGLAFLALGITLLIAAEGPDPWGLLVLALNQRIGVLSLGITAQVGGLLLVLLNLFWGKRVPGIATILSMVLVGVFLDMFNTLLALGQGLGQPGKSLLLMGGILTLALGIAVYVRAGLGEGPVEGMMFVISQKLGVGIGAAKVLQDISFVSLGWILGWPPQLGTLISAVAVGPVTQLFFRIMDRQKTAHYAPK